MINNCPLSVRDQLRIKLRGKCVSYTCSNDCSFSQNNLNVRRMISQLEKDLASMITPFSLNNTVQAEKLQLAAEDYMKHLKAKNVFQDFKVETHTDALRAGWDLDVTIQPNQTLEYIQIRFEIK